MSCVNNSEFQNNVRDLKFALSEAMGLRAKANPQNPYPDSAKPLTPPCGSKVAWKHASILSTIINAFLLILSINVLYISLHGSQASLLEIQKCISFPIHTVTLLMLLILFVKYNDMFQLLWRVIINTLSPSDKWMMVLTVCVTITILAIQNLHQHDAKLVVLALLLITFVAARLMLQLYGMQTSDKVENASCYNSFFDNPHTASVYLNQVLSDQYVGCKKMAFNGP